MTSNNGDIKTLSGRGEKISLLEDSFGWRVMWGKMHFSISYIYIKKIFEEYLTDDNEWYPLGASMTDPIPGGFGEYLKGHLPPLSPRHASAIAAVMFHKELIDIKGNKPIFIKPRKTIKEMKSILS